jgi:hypothetical protein
MEIEYAYVAQQPAHLQAELRLLPPFLDRHTHFFTTFPLLLGSPRFLDLWPHNIENQQARLLRPRRLEVSALLI